MRKIQIQSERLNIFLPEINEALKAQNYFVTNQLHLRPTDPVLPKGFLTLPFWEKRLSSNIEEFERDQSVRFFIELKNSPKDFVGVANLTQIARGPFQACYLGYSIAREHEGKGLMFEALKAVINFAFTDKHLHRIMANHLPENKRSANVLKRLGFRVDGSAPDYLYIQGQWREHVLTSITNSHWLPREEDKAIFE